MTCALPVTIEVFRSKRHPGAETLSPRNRCEVGGGSHWIAIASTTLLGESNKSRSAFPSPEKSPKAADHHDIVPGYQMKSWTKSKRRSFMNQAADLTGYGIPPDQLPVRCARAVQGTAPPIGSHPEAADTA